MSQDSDGYFGTQEVSSATNEYNAMVFVIRQIMSGKHYCALVKIVAVTSAGTVAKAGTVDVQPMVNQLDGMGNAVPHGVVNGLPYMRLQGGGNAFIMDPVVGDIGLALFADRDISSVKATGAIANPGSLRQSDMADGIYFGGLLNGVPTQYVQFAAAGITISSPNQINLVAPVIVVNASTSCTVTTPQFIVHGASTLDGPVHATSTILADTTITATTDVIGGGKSLKTHTHGGVQSGTSFTLPPT